ncbi:MAG: hypothetical protein MK171_10835 [Pirellulales bacterium]|nr:hypothetical protein [Pirellulales bacterium]
MIAHRPKNGPALMDRLSTYRSAPVFSMHRYSSLSDDYYVNMNLSTEMELPGNRETVLHFFEQMQKKYPELRNFYAREKRNFVLEEDKDSGSYSWCSVEPRRFCSGQVNPSQVSDALDLHRHALEIAPYALSISPLDCEALDLLIGFDFNYRGNQNQLVAEALGVSPAMEGLSGIPGSTILNNEPNITLALDEECRLQCRLSIEPRTNAFQVRTGEYQEEQISVYVTARQYGSLAADQTYVDTLDRLHKVCLEMIDSYVADAVLQPLARTIAME